MISYSLGMVLYNSFGIFSTAINCRHAIVSAVNRRSSTFLGSEFLFKGLPLFYSVIFSSTLLLKRLLTISTKDGLYSISSAKRVKFLTPSICLSSASFSLLSRALCCLTIILILFSFCFNSLSNIDLIFSRRSLEPILVQSIVENF